MFKPFLSLLLFLFGCTNLAAQKTYSSELSVITDNDNYDLDFSDRYYSNGFILNFYWAGNKKPLQKISTKINRIELGHKVYNPYKNNGSINEVLQNMDRPFAGWLYGSFGKTFISNRDHVFLYDAIIGIMGPDALGKQIQRGWHKLIGLYNVYGWEYQLHDEIGINASAAYFHSLIQSAENKNLTLHFVSKATLGNTFTNASAGLLFKTGKLNAERETGFWGANLNANTKSFNKKEWIFFLEPVLQYQIYNATVQGPLFSHDKGPFQTGISYLVFQTRTGLIVTGNKVGFRWYYTFRSKEGSQMNKGEHWGTIGLSFRF